MVRYYVTRKIHFLFDFRDQTYKTLLKLVETCSCFAQIILSQVENILRLSKRMQLVFVQYIAQQ